MRTSQRPSSSPFSREGIDHLDGHGRDLPLHLPLRWWLFWQRHRSWLQAGKAGPRAAAPSGLRLGSGCHAQSRSPGGLCQDGRAVPAGHPPWRPRAAVPLVPAWSADGSCGGPAAANCQQLPRSPGVCRRWLQRCCSARVPCSSFWLSPPSCRLCCRRWLQGCCTACRRWLQEGCCSSGVKAEAHGGWPAAACSLRPAALGAAAADRSFCRGGGKFREPLGGTSLRDIRLRN
jgi:hypothetical protein